MGLFSDNCQAIIDPSTGKALTGVALVEAKNDPNAPRCGHKVKKAAKFCSKCGSTSPNGWWQCPSCKKWVGNDSHYCWNCSTPMYTEGRGDLNGGVWQRTVGKIAERFEVGDVNRLIKDGLKIQEGTCALILDAGEYKGSIGSGEHNVDSMARKINHFGSPPPRTLVLVDCSLIALPLKIEGLRSAEELSINFYGEVALQFQRKRGKEFVANYLKEQKEITIEEVAEYLEGAIRHGVDEFCVSSTIEDIVKDPARRIRLEDTLSKALKESAYDYGFDIVRVSSAEFYGRAYEELRQKAEDIELKRRETLFENDLREILTQEKMDEFKSEHDLQQYVDQLAQERGVSSIKRDHEINVLKQVHRHELDLEEQRHFKEVQIEQMSAEIATAKMRDDFELEKTEKWLEMKRKKQAVSREHTEELANIMDGQSFETMIALIDDPDKREQLMELQRRMNAKGKTAEEILALDAAGSANAAQALSKLQEFKENSLDEQLKREEHLNKEHRDQLERLMKQALESMGEAAKHHGPSTTINK